MSKSLWRTASLPTLVVTHTIVVVNNGNLQLIQVSCIYDNNNRQKTAKALQLFIL